MVEATVRNVDRNVPFKGVTATRGKALRAEPISALYEQGRVHHVGMFIELEEQMREWVPTERKQKSPDRLDALVWALTELSEGSSSMMSLMGLSVMCPNCNMPSKKGTPICDVCGTALPLEGEVS